MPSGNRPVALLIVGKNHLNAAFVDDFKKIAIETGAIALPKLEIPRTLSAMNLKDLSSILGISQTTISRALNGYPEVNEGTRTRILEAAKKYNYKPNLNATRLATGRSMAIGHVIPLSSKKEMVNPVFSDFFAGVGEACGREGYDLLLSVVADQDHERAYRELAERGAVDGLIVQFPAVSDLRIKMLKEVGMPFVVHGRCLNETSDYSWLDIDNKAAFRRATNHLLDQGHTRIALINGDETLDFAARRRQGYESALRERGIMPNPDYMRSGRMTEASGQVAASEMMRLHPFPTAYLTSSILSAIGVRQAVHEAGYGLGRDISIVTHDDDLSYLKNSGDVPQFTATRSSVRDAGRRCADILLELIRNTDSGPICELWDAELLIGASTGLNSDPSAQRATRVSSSPCQEARSSLGTAELEDTAMQ